jgi:Tfp pilus assembly protein PilO
VPKIAIRTHHLAEWAGAMDGFFKSARRHVIAGMIIAGTNLAAVGAYWLHSHDAQIAAAAASDEQARSFHEYKTARALELDDLRRQIAELRAVLLRLGVSVPATGGETDVPTDADRVSVRR